MQSCMEAFQSSLSYITVKLRRFAIYQESLSTHLIFLNVCHRLALTSPLGILIDVISQYIRKPYQSNCFNKLLLLCKPFNLRGYLIKCIMLCIMYIYVYLCIFGCSLGKVRSKVRFKFNQQITNFKITIPRIMWPQENVLRHTNTCWPSNARYVIQPVGVPSVVEFCFQHPPRTHISTGMRGNSRVGVLLG